MKSIYKKEEKLVLRDGVELCSTLWAPSKEGSWPTLLMRQPYGKDIASTITYPHPHWWVKHGYLVVIQDVRGQGKSGGEFKGFEQEALDTTETHKWIRTLPECNGLLGTYGFSYQGLTQLLALPNSHPPDCLAPAMTGFSECDHWSCEGGAFWWHIGLAWGLQLAAQRLKREKNIEAWKEIKSSLENNSYLLNGHELLKKYDKEGMANKWLKQSNENCKNWTIHNSQKELLRKPILLIGGWWDPHLNGIIDIYESSIKQGGRPELHIGPASHLNWWEDSHKLHLDFFNKYLKSSENHINKKPVNKFWNITCEGWEEIQQLTVNCPKWTLYSSGLACLDINDGLLLEELSKGQGEVALVHDPWRPCPSIGGHLSQNPGLADRKEIDKRTDVATFTTKPLSNAIKIGGRPKLEIIASSEQEGFDLFITLSIIEENSSSVSQISTGVVRLLNKSTKEKLLRVINLQPIFADIKKGARLRLSISAAAWPAIGINPGHMDEAPGPPSPTCLVTTVFMELSQAKLSFCPLITNNSTTLH